MTGIAAGVGLAWVRRDGVGVPGVAASAVLASAVLASAGSVWLAAVDVAVLSSAESAVVFVSVPSSALPAPLLVASDCVCCSAVAGGCIASAMAGIGNVALTMDVHAIAQSR